MPAHCPRALRIRSSRAPKSFRILLPSLALALLVQGCAAPPAPLAGADPADPRCPGAARRVPRDAVCEPASGRPSGWPEQNERVAPRQKQ